MVIMNNITNINKIDDDKIKAFAFELQYFIEESGDNANFEDTFDFVTTRAAEIVGLEDEYYDGWLEDCGLSEVANGRLEWLLGCRELFKHRDDKQELTDELKSLNDYGVARLVVSTFINKAAEYMPYGEWGSMIAHDLANVGQ